jgi:hypothetical protein
MWMVSILDRHDFIKNIVSKKPFFSNLEKSVNSFMSRKSNFLFQKKQNNIVIGSRVISSFFGFFGSDGGNGLKYLELIVSKP